MAVLITPCNFIHDLKFFRYSIRSLSSLYNFIWGFLNFAGNRAFSISLVNDGSTSSKSGSAGLFSISFTCFLSLFNYTSRLVDPILPLELSEPYFLYWCFKFNLWRKSYLAFSTCQRFFGWSVWLTQVSSLLDDIVWLLFWQTHCELLLLSCGASCKSFYSLSSSFHRGGFGFALCS